MPEQAKDQTWKNGQLITETLRTVSDAEIERRDMPLFLRQRLPQLRQWSSDAKSTAEITAMAAVERIARQAVIEDRVAKMARLLMGLAWRVGEDDGS